MAGKSHNARSAEAKAKAMQAVDKLPEPPAGLLKSERETFEALTKSLAADKWTPALVLAATRICKAFTKLAELDRALKRQGNMVIAQSGVYQGMEVPNPTLKARAEQERQIMSLMRTCGLGLFGQAKNSPQSDRARGNERAAIAANEGLAHLEQLLAGGSGGAAAN